MTKWTENKCGYCEHEEADLERLECPECKRTGCPICMPNGGASPCPSCVEVAEQAKASEHLGS